MQSYIDRIYKIWGAVIKWTLLVLLALALWLSGTLTDANASIRERHCTPLTYGRPNSCYVHPMERTQPWDYWWNWLNHQR